jgi:hypothetical protein
VIESHSPDFRAIILDIQALRHRALAGRDALQHAHPTWPLGQDARLTAFGKFVNSLNATQLALMFLDQHLLDQGWWEESGLTRPMGRDFEVAVVEFSQFAKSGFLQGIFSDVESTFRLVLRAIDSGACDGGTAEFQSIYRVLLGTKLRVPRADWEPLLELWRLLRNTVHNNGVHFHRRGANAQVLYKGVSYDFAHGNPVEFASWPFLVSAAGGLLDLLLATVRAHEVVSVPGPIVDPQS